MEVPDVIGFVLDEASERLAGAGLSIHDIRVIVPPRDINPCYDGSYRVIKIDALDDKNVVLHICKPL